jgi:4-aminobutyrate aminotransferase-like enzyme
VYRAGLKHPLIEYIRGKGLFLAVALKRDVDLDRFIKTAFTNGLVIDQFLFSGDSFRIAPPLIITETEVAHSIQRVLASLDELAK